MLLVFVGIFALAVFGIVAGLRTLTGSAKETKEDSMPQTFSRIAYVVLIILMFGICAGFLGAA